MRPREKSIYELNETVFRRNPGARWLTATTRSLIARDGAVVAVTFQIPLRPYLRCSAAGIAAFADAS
jgi:hypothetical protein